MKKNRYLGIMLLLLYYTTYIIIIQYYFHIVTKVLMFLSAIQFWT